MEVYILPAMPVVSEGSNAQLVCLVSGGWGRGRGGGERLELEGEGECMFVCVHRIGFTSKKVQDKRYVYEQPRIIKWQCKYLRRMRKNRSENRPVVFFDETWVNAHDGRERTLVGVDQATGGTKGGVRKPSGKGTRLIILHAGSCKAGMSLKSGSAAPRRASIQRGN